MEVTAKKPLLKNTKKKRRSPQTIFLEKYMKKIKVRNPATERINALWNFRILSPKALKVMTPDNRKAFVKLHKKYKKEEAKALKKWRKQHGVKRKDVAPTSELPRHLLGRHKILSRRYKDERIDMGEGPKRVADLLKDAKKDPEQYAEIIAKVDEHHKKERRRVIRRHGDATMMHGGKVVTVKEAIADAVKNDDEKLFKKAMGW